MSARDILLLAAEDAFEFERWREAGPVTAEIDPEVAAAEIVEYEALGIPPGVYRCALVQSPRFGRVYHVRDVPGRDAVLIHAGNVAGAIPKYRTHVQGCILLGEQRGRIDGQRAVLVSRPAVRRFLAALKGEPFELEVLDA